MSLVQCINYVQLRLEYLGSANIRIGRAQQDSPLNIPHCIARRTSQVPKRNVQDQVSLYFGKDLISFFKVLFVIRKKEKFTDNAVLVMFSLLCYWILDAQFSGYNCTAYGARKGL